MPIGPRKRPDANVSPEPCAEFSALHACTLRRAPSKLISELYAAQLLVSFLIALAELQTYGWASQCREPFYLLFSFSNLQTPKYLSFCAAAEILKASAFELCARFYRQRRGSSAGIFPQSAEARPIMRPSSLDQRCPAAFRNMYQWVKQSASSTKRIASGVSARCAKLTGLR